MIIPMLSNEALRNIQNECALAKDELQTALFSHWHQLGISNIEERSRVGRPRVIQCLGAYAVKIFEVEAKELVTLKLEPADLSKCFDELGVRVTYQVMPPQFSINSGFYLGDLHYDAEYRKFIADGIGDCVRVWRKKHVPETKGSDDPSPGEILDAYRERANLTIRQLAQKARVDESVIYAIKAGRKKFSVDALGRVATVVGCEPDRLAPKE
jgi:Helix-turn-helix domain